MFPGITETNKRIMKKITCIAIDSHYINETVILNYFSWHFDLGRDGRSVDSLKQILEIGA